MLAAGELSGHHLLVADGAHVRMLLNFLGRSIVQTLDLSDGCPSFAKGRPTALGLAPDVEVGVD